MRRSATNSWRASAAGEFLHGAMRLVDRRVGVSGGAGVRVGDRDAAEGSPANLMWRAALRPVWIEQWVVLVGVSVRPAVNCDRRNIRVRIEAAAAQDAHELVANFVLECR